MTVLHVHADSASLERHMEVAGPRFPPIGELISMVGIDVYGRPSEGVLARLREKAELLGSGRVRVHDHHAGFARIGGG